LRALARGAVEVQIETQPHRGCHLPLTESARGIYGLDRKCFPIR
jgi:hypothetical protein